MSVQAMAWAIQQQIAKDPRARHVLLCLANYADQDGDSAFPSLASLQRDTGLGESTVRRKLQELIALGVVAESSQKYALAKIGRADRVPKCYRIRGVTATPRSVNGVSGRALRGVTASATGCQALTPDPSLSVKKEPARIRAKKNPLCVRCAEAESVTVLKGNPYCFKCAKIKCAEDHEASSEVAKRIGALLPKQARA